MKENRQLEKRQPEVVRGRRALNQWRVTRGVAKEKKPLINEDGQGLVRRLEKRPATSDDGHGMLRNMVVEMFTR